MQKFIFKENQLKRKLGFFKVLCLLLACLSIYQFAKLQAYENKKIINNTKYVIVSNDTNYNDYINKQLKEIPPQNVFNN